MLSLRYIFILVYICVSALVFAHHAHAVSAEATRDLIPGTLQLQAALSCLIGMLGTEPGFFYKSSKCSLPLSDL